MFSKLTSDNDNVCIAATTVYGNWIEFYRKPPSIHSCAFELRNQAEKFREVISIKTIGHSISSLNSSRAPLFSQFSKLHSMSFYDLEMILLSRSVAGNQLPQPL